MISSTPSPSPEDVVTLAAEDVRLATNNSCETATTTATCDCAQETPGTGAPQPVTPITPSVDADTSPILSSSGSPRSSSTTKGIVIPSPPSSSKSVPPPRPRRTAKLGEERSPQNQKSPMTAIDDQESDANRRMMSGSQSMPPPPPPPSARSSRSSLFTSALPTPSPPPSLLRRPGLNTEYSARLQNAQSYHIIDTLSDRGAQSLHGSFSEQKASSSPRVVRSSASSPSIFRRSPPPALDMFNFNTPERRSVASSFSPATSASASPRGDRTETPGRAWDYYSTGAPISAVSSFASGASPVGTPGTATRGGRRSSRSLVSGGVSDTGYSDRFIPSRARSNLNLSVWDSMDPFASQNQTQSQPSPQQQSHPNVSQRYSQSQGGNQLDDSGASHVHTHTRAAYAYDGPSVAGGISGITGEPALAEGGSVGGGSGSGDGSGSGVVSAGSRQATMSGGSVGDGSANPQPPLLNILLRSELLGENADPAPTSPSIATRSGNYFSNGTPLRDGGNVLRFENPNAGGSRSHGSSFVDADSNGRATSVVDSFSLTPVGSASSHLLFSTPQKRKRRIAKVPFKVLDAPALQDDFYLNLVDWSSLNVLAVGLGSCVYLWSACTSKVTKLCDLAQSEDIVTSVAWTQRGTHLAVGTNRGEVQLWDGTKCKKVRTMAGHSARIGTLSWSGPTLASGSRDRLIYLRDVRVEEPFVARLAAHKQEVCGLKWSFDEPAHLASGGNDNKLLVWDIKNHSQPVHRFAEHTAAVKAIAWSPHQHGLLASGGGTADRCIRFWNTLSGADLNCVDTGSQVCNLAWSQNCNEIVSTHGYSLNQIVVWRYPTMSKVATLTGHTYRVLYLAVSPDGSTIVTGAGDETLRFWQVFPGPRSHDKSTGSGLLFPSAPGSVIR